MNTKQLSGTGCRSWFQILYICLECAVCGAVYRYCVHTMHRYCVLPMFCVCILYCVCVYCVYAQHFVCCALFIGTWGSRLQKQGTAKTQACCGKGKHPPPLLLGSWIILLQFCHGPALGETCKVCRSWGTAEKATHFLYFSILGNYFLSNTGRLSCIAPSYLGAITRDRIAVAGNGPISRCRHQACWTMGISEKRSGIPLIQSGFDWVGRGQCRPVKGILRTGAEDIPGAWKEQVSSIYATTFCLIHQMSLHPCFGVLSKQNNTCL